LDVLIKENDPEPGYEDVIEYTLRVTNLDECVYDANAGL